MAKPGKRAAILTHFADRTRAPRRWWFPIYPESQKPEEPWGGILEEEQEALDKEWQALAQAHEETSKTVRKTLFAHIAFSFFCVFTLLGTPDRDLVAEGANLRVPIPFVAGYEMPFSGFLLVGPVVLLGVTLYLHVFIQHLRVLDAVPTALQVPFVFNLPHTSARLLSQALKYWLTPAVLGVFAWKTLALPGVGPLFFSSYALSLAWSLLLQIRRCRSGRRRSNIIRWLVLLALVGGVVDYPRLRGLRRMNLFKADLRGQDLRGRFLPGADLREALLCGADLRYARLTDADLELADLSAGKMLEEGRERSCGAANLSRATLTEADLSKAKLIDVNLEMANLEGANLSGALMSRANLRAANLAGADLGLADLTNAYAEYATLTEAVLFGAKLSNAELQNADLTNARMANAQLDGTILRFANLSGAQFLDILHEPQPPPLGLTQQQIDSACADTKVQLPWFGQPPSCSELFRDSPE